MPSWSPAGLPVWTKANMTNTNRKVVESPLLIFHVISEIDTKAKVCKELFFCSAFTCWAMNSSKVEPLRVKGVAPYIYESIRQNAAHSLDNHPVDCAKVMVAWEDHDLDVCHFASRAWNVPHLHPARYLFQLIFCQRLEVHRVFLSTTFYSLGRHKEKQKP